ncbi:Lipoyltransferase and lipoate-protein ligase, partial [Lentinula aff. detonsa]
RSYSSPSIPTPQHSIYISKSTSPYFNLSFEDWFVLFRHKAPDKPLLLLYRDDPCVVIGRNQNPWKEVNLSALRAREGIPFIRRRSGGGTVYHDLGNTNFSIHLPRISFNRHLTAQVILRAVRSLGIDATVNDRNDICVGKEKICCVSSCALLSCQNRSAYKIVSQRAYHHGTMLISTQLDTLGDLLHNTKDTMETKGVASVRSPVRNLQQFKPTVTHEAFVDAVIHEFREEYEVRAVNDVDNCKDIEYIQDGMLELPSWDWAYGQTPEFTYTVSQAFEWGTVKAKIRSKHGLILDCDLSVSNTDSQEVERALQGRKYGFVSAMDILNGLGNKTGTRVKEDVAFWLESMMNS